MEKIIAGLLRETFDWIHWDFNTLTVSEQKIIGSQETFDKIKARVAQKEKE